MRSNAAIDLGRWHKNNHPRELTFFIGLDADMSPGLCMFNLSSTFSWALHREVCRALVDGGSCRGYDGPFKKLV